MDLSAVQQQFSAALDTLVADIKKDTAVLAALLCGSLSHDAVWEKSDIDLVLITIDDKKVATQHLALVADDVNVHAFLVPRAEFRKSVESATQHSFMHSLLAKGRLLYTHDESLVALCQRLQSLGAHDTAVQLLRAGAHALPPLYKARKWLVTRGDLEYTALWLLYSATPLAQIEVLSRGRLLDREVLPQAMALAPDLFGTVYVNLLNAPKTTASVEHALVTAEAYLLERAPRLFAPVLDYLDTAGDARSCTEIEDHFVRHLNAANMTTVCEYLADQKLIGKASVAARLTKRSRVDVQELAFYSLRDGH